MVVQSKIHYRVEVINGLIEAQRTICRLFDGSNKGKLIVKVSEAPFLKH